jgi:YbbR domain-containing protein
VSIESATPVDVDFRIEYRTADDIMVMGEAPALVHTTLRGPWATFRSYDPAELKPVVIDLSDAGPGTIRHQLDTADIEPPGGMTVVAVRPSEVELTLDRKVERRVAVEVDLVGSPADGFELEGVTAQPAGARVIGPARDMETIERVFTRPVDVEGRQDDFTAEVDLRSPQLPLRLRDRRVTVGVRIHEELITRAFDDLPVKVEGGPAGARAVPDKVSLKLKGPRLLVEALDPKTLVPFVDLSTGPVGAETPLERTVDLRGRPERAQWIGAAPTVQIILPKPRPSAPKRK